MIDTHFCTSSDVTTILVHWYYSYSIDHLEIFCITLYMTVIHVSFPLSTALPTSHLINALRHTMAHLSGFPPGYFVIRSVATGRLWDVNSDEVEDGTPVILWPEKEQSLVESG